MKGMSMIRTLAASAALVLVAGTMAYAQAKLEIVGGDLSRSEKLIISIAALGRAKRPLLRSGAKWNDERQGKEQKRSCEMAALHREFLHRKARHT